jgi:hypothetical protein
MTRLLSLVVALMVCTPLKASAATPEEIAAAQAQVAALEAQKSALQIANAADREEIARLTNEVAIYEGRIAEIKALFRAVRQKHAELAEAWQALNAKLK